MTFRTEDGDEFVRGQMEYWGQVKESEGFDVDHISAPQGTTGLMPFDCERDDVLVKRYARMGLHRYNMSQGTNFQLRHLKKFNVTMNCLGTYYITLVAFDPATTSLLTFLVGVAEEAYGRLHLSCFIARPQGAPKDNLPFNPVDFGPVDRSLPCWPSDFNDIDRFYLVKESELQDNDWIRLYLELALCTNDRGISDNALSQLQIVKVAIETNENNEPLQAKSATFYITFKGLAMARIGEIGEHVERKVIVRRVINEHTGYLTLLGGFGFSIGEEAEQRPMTRRNFESSEQCTRRLRLTPSVIEDGDEFVRGYMEYWRQVKESEGFDVDHISAPQGTNGLMPFDCEREDVRYPDPVLVKRYARMGLHRYNMSQGTNFQLHHLKKFNVRMNFLGTYYITLVAFDPATTSLLTFQVGVAEKAYGSLNLSCFIARPQGAPKDSMPFNPVDFGPVDCSLLCWPSDFNDIDEFYLVKESELQDNDWIRLYLELALCIDDRGISDSALSQLQIVKVAIETNENNEPLQAKSATLCITFKGLAMVRIGEIGEHVERKVIVRRVINEHTGYLTLLGGFGFSIGEEAD